MPVSLGNLLNMGKRSLSYVVAAPFAARAAIVTGQIYFYVRPSY